VKFSLAITAYNRPEMLRQVFAGLADALCWNSSYKLIEKLYVFSDGPRDKADVPLVNQVRDIAHAWDWTDVEVIEHAKNTSQKWAIPYAMDYVLSRHEVAVHLEDDVVPGLYFLPFMAQALERYADVPNVYGICGYTRTLPDDVVSPWPYDAHLYPRVGTAAWGTWKRAWSKHTCRDLPEMAQIADSAGLDFSVGGDDLLPCLAKYLKSETANWSLAWGLRMALDDGLYLYPMRSLVENIGHGTGVSNSHHHGPPLAMAEKPLREFPPVYQKMGQDVCKAMRALYT